MNYEDILFGAWLNENGWQPYDGWDRWINQGLFNTVEDLQKLFEDYKKENPEP